MATAEEKARLDKPHLWVNLVERRQTPAEKAAAAARLAQSVGTAAMPAAEVIVVDLPANDVK